ncbi:MAG: ABC transporter ATP-binding protein [Bacilli bacterium]|nr:ABC transporter ATP-binding protein [Bacilli bacterium]
MIFGKHINRYYVKYWYYFIAVFLIDTTVDIVQLLVPLLIGNVITAFDKKDTLPVGHSNNIFRALTGFEYQFTIFEEGVPIYQSDLFVVLLTLATIALIIFSGRVGWRALSARIGAKIERDLRRDMFAHIQKMSLAYYNQNKVGSLLSFFTNDLITIKLCFTDGLIFETDLLVLGTLSIVLMTMMSWQITLYTVIPLLLFIIFGGVVGKEESKRFKISSDAFDHVSDYTEENLQGFSVVKSFLKEKETLKTFRKLTQDAATKNFSYMKFSSLIEQGIQIFLAITFAVLFVLGSVSIINKDVPFAGSLTDIGKFSTFIGYYDALIWPMIAGGMIIDYISRGNGAQKRIAEILDSKPDIVDDDNPVRDTLVGDVVYNHVIFQYPDGDHNIIKDVSFHITPGMSVGILGRTGSGKSTLVSLMTKLYNLPRGMLLIDGVDINDWRKRDLRTQIGYVLQEGFLFSGTIKDNIAFSEDIPGVYDMEKVKESARFAAIEEDILSFRDGYDTIVGEKGATLSGGQRQRVSIARAIYKQPKMLILDDSLSAVDADTEKSILSHLQGRENKITSFIIAHRVSAIQNCDLILVMKKGVLIGMGKHDELLETCPFYRDICELQKLEKEVN